MARIELSNIGGGGGGGSTTLALTTTGTSGASALTTVPGGYSLNIPVYQGALTLSTAGTSGASTLVGDTLTIPTYQGQISLTTTGTSGASTFVGNTLNIPTYQGAISLTTTGTSGAATLVGNTLNVPQYSTAPSGSTGEIQYNNAGAFAASANLAWDDSFVRLNVGAPSSPTGKLNVKGQGTTSATVNLRLTDSGNTELLKVLDNGSTNIGTGFNWDNANGRLGIGTASPSTTLSIAGNSTFAGVATFTGTFPYFELKPSAWGSTYFYLQAGVNILAQNAGDYTALLNHQGSGKGFTFIQGSNSSLTIAPTTYNVSIGTGTSVGSARLHIRGSNTSSGTNALLVQNSTPSDIYKIENDGKISYWATNTAAGTTGAQTINRPSGTVNFAAGATALVVTNSLCTTASLVFAEVRTNDATAQIKNVVPAAGSFTINLSAAATAETSVGFFIIN